MNKADNTAKEQSSPSAKDIAALADITGKEREKVGVKTPDNTGEKQGNAAFEGKALSVFGRPSKYPTSKEDIEALHGDVIGYGREGFSKTQIAVKLGISRTTLYSWTEKHSDFLDTIKRAQEAAQAHWEDLGMELARTGAGNATAFIFQMKNRFPKDYKDRKAVDLTSSDESMKAQQVIYQLPDNGRG